MQHLELNSASIEKSVAAWALSRPGEGMLVLLPEAGTSLVPQLQGLCRQHHIALCGGIFPAIVSAGDFVSDSVLGHVHTLVGDCVLMSRIKSAFDRLNAEGRKALIPFVTAGDPDVALTLPLLHTLVEAGADVIELGVPFSDPMADGPTIQRASERALALS